jgi:hypothetical protein
MQRLAPGITQVATFKTSNAFVLDVDGDLFLIDTGTANGLPGWRLVYLKADPKRARLVVGSPSVVAGVSGRRSAAFGACAAPLRHSGWSGWLTGQQCEHGRRN